MMMRQIHFASVDLELHSRFQPGQSESVFERDQAIAKKTSVMPPLPEDRCAKLQMYSLADAIQKTLPGSLYFC